MNKVDSLGTLNMLVFCLLEDGTITLVNEEPDGAFYSIKKLTLTRLRDKSTGRERLSAALFDGYYDTSPYAVSYCNPIDLQSDLIRLGEFGFVVKRKEVMNIVQDIEKHYHKLTINVDEDAKTLEGDFPGILRYICGYILDKKIKARKINGNAVYNVCVNDFKTLFEGSPFARYRNTDVRRMLRDMGYTLCSPDRFDNTIKVRNKSESGTTIKVVSLLVEEMADAMAEVMDDAEREDE